MKLYYELVYLTETNEAFYFKDFPAHNSGVYRIFNYRLAQYSDWLLPSALEARGIMFHIVNGAVTLVCRPMEKFFNDSENPLAENLDYTNIKQAMYKEDGSLISSYIGDDDKLHLKSKGSISSEQAIAAEKLLEADVEFYKEVESFTRSGYTVNMEYVGPTNRIVLPYERHSLVVLNIRDICSGKYLHENFYRDSYILDQWVAEYPFTTVDALKAVEGIEGAVIQLESGQHVKIKTDWYLVRHRAKDSVNNPKALIAAVLEEATDDLRSLFTDDQITLSLIERYENHISTTYNHVIHLLNRFHDFEKKSDRKSYAIAAKDYWLDRPEFFGAQMNMWQGKEIEDYVKDKILKHYKDYILDVLDFKEEE